MILAKIVGLECFAKGFYMVFLLCGTDKDEGKISNILLTTEKKLIILKLINFIAHNINLKISLKKIFELIKT